MLRVAEHRLEFRSVGLILSLGMWLLAAGILPAQDPPPPTPAPATAHPHRLVDSAMLLSRLLRRLLQQTQNNPTTRIGGNHDARHRAYLQSARERSAGARRGARSIRQGHSRISRRKISSFPTIKKPQTITSFRVETPETESCEASGDDDPKISTVPRRR